MNNMLFEDMVSLAEMAGLEVTLYPKQRLINIKDSDEIIQSYYASTGTAIFRDCNDKWKQKRKTFRNFPFDRFLVLCKGDTDDDILDFFEEEY